VKPSEIRATVMELRHATRPEQRTAYERALEARADLVDEMMVETMNGANGEVQRKLATLLYPRQLHLIDDLRAAVPRKARS